jgi:hypothetical protein
LLVSMTFTEFGPKTLINDTMAHAVGTVCGVYSDRDISWPKLQKHIAGINIEQRVVPHAKQLKKIEIRQLNAVLNNYCQWNNRNA